MTKFYVDGSGKYIGGFDGIAPPIGAIEVPEPPNHGKQVWNGAAWGAIPPLERIPTIEDVLQLLRTKAVITQAEIDTIKGKP